MQLLSDAESTELRGHSGWPHPEQAPGLAAAPEPSSGVTPTAGYNQGQTQAMPPAHWDVLSSVPPQGRAGQGTPGQVAQAGGVCRAASDRGQHMPLLIL